MARGQYVTLTSTALRDVVAIEAVSRAGQTKTGRSRSRSPGIHRPVQLALERGHARRRSGGSGTSLPADRIVAEPICGPGRQKGLREGLGFASSRRRGARPKPNEATAYGKPAVFGPRRVRFRPRFRLDHELDPRCAHIGDAGLIERRTERSGQRTPLPPPSPRRLPSAPGSAGFERPEGPRARGERCRS